ncbi:hypothetical protein [Rhodovibrio salinarum]|uniref:hypothetical protein n=1 Tax=Rhodovibrio salinarum TaxID=1087 RepID=UPI00068530F9|nr:hypothetical protein [Rhodovibrio salinarum]
MPAIPSVTTQQVRAGAVATGGGRRRAGRLLAGAVLSGLVVGGALWGADMTGASVHARMPGDKRHGRDLLLERWPACE